MNKIIHIISLLALFCHLSANAESIMDKWAESALLVRQIPGSEQALSNYFAGDSGIIYAVIYPPANCPRCEAMINEAYRGLKEVNDSNKVILVSCYPDAKAARQYNIKKGYTADKYIYDTDKGYLDFLSFSAGYLHIVYLLKIDIDKGKLIYGGDFNYASPEFFQDLANCSDYAPQQRLGETIVREPDPFPTAFDNMAKPSQIIKLATPDSVLISDIKYPPSFRGGTLALHDELRNSTLLFTLDSARRKAQFKTEIKSNAQENRSFVSVPEWYYQSCLKEGSVYFIALTPQITPEGKLVVSYSLPNLFIIEDDTNDEMLSVGYKNKPCLIVRDINNDMTPLPLMPINNDFSLGYFYSHFTFLAMGDTAIVPCQKLTWPLSTDESEYRGYAERDPFCDKFYETRNPIFGMFDLKTGNLISRFGNLGEPQAKSKTGYYFVNAIAADLNGTIAYSDGESGQICVAHACSPDSVTAKYAAFDFDTSQFPAPDSTRFYSYECVAPYTKHFYRRITAMQLSPTHIHCIVRYGSHGEELPGDIYSHVKINRASGHRTETKLDTGKAQVKAVELWNNDNLRIMPYAITKHDGTHYIEVF